MLGLLTLLHAGALQNNDMKPAADAKVAAMAPTLPASALRTSEKTPANADTPLSAASRRGSSQPGTTPLPPVSATHTSSGLPLHNVDQLRARVLDLMFQFTASGGAVPGPTSAAALPALLAKVTLTPSDNTGAPSYGIPISYFYRFS